MIEFNLINEYIEPPFDAASIIHKILLEIAKVEELDEDHIVSIILVDNNKIHEINNLYRKIDRATDVISFAEIDGTEDRSLPYDLGTIFISLDKVEEQANSFGHSLLREFAFLVTHGMYHLQGFDHMNKEEEIVMFKKQDIILDNLKIYR